MVCRRTLLRFSNRGPSVSNDFVLLTPLFNLIFFLSQFYWSEFETGKGKREKIFLPV